MRASPLLLGLSVLVFAPLAAAQSTSPSIDARTWRPSTDPAAGLILEPTTTPGAGSWNFGAWGSYALHPVTLNDPATGARLRAVRDEVGLDLGFGIGIGSRAALGVSLPMALYQDGTKGLPASISTSGQAPMSAIGDLALNGKVSIVDASQGGFGLAALATVTVPTGDPGSFLGEGSVTAGARLLAEYTLLVASLEASAGYTARTANPTVGGYEFGDVIPWTFGASLKPDLFKLDPSHRQRWELAFHGWLPITPVGPFGAGSPGSARETPVLLTLSDRLELGHYRDVYAVGGFDIGLTDAIGVPTVRFIAGIGWAPRDHDLDKDGVPDDVDQCPEIPEDRDGFEDRDGCPEIDNDDDGILDKDDACPNVPGVPSDDPKKNGCPGPREPGPASDRDHDGIPDEADRCPDQPEDKDGNQDDDGCPDPDDDGDGIADTEDACPRVPGDPSSDPKLNGCPNPDRDGDTYDNAVDKCPDEPETWNGVADDDGCPDTGGKPLVVVKEEKGGKVRLEVAASDKLTAGGPTLRAIAFEANQHRGWKLLVAVRGANVANVANVKRGVADAAAIADSLDGLAHRDVAEAIAWDEVKVEPATTANVKIVVVPVVAKDEAAKREPAMTPLPAAKP
jgi:hypothetical protein